MVVVLHRQTSTTRPNPIPETVQILDGTGHVIASQDFNAPASPYVAGCVTVLPPAVHVTGEAAYFADSVGAIHRLGIDGSVSQVASFPITPQSFLSFAVRPDAQKLDAIVFSTPPLTGAPIQFGIDPFVASGHWTLDLEEASANGATTKVLHKDYGHTFTGGGPTWMAGWDRNGAVATVNTNFCVQNPLVSDAYPGGGLIHLAADGTHLDAIGGSTCEPLDELPDSTVLCTGTDWTKFSVRLRGGSQLWSRSNTNQVWDPKVSPDANNVTMNRLPGSPAVLFRRSSSGPATVPATAGTVYLLGWFGSSKIVVVEGSKLGIVATSSLSSFTSFETIYIGCSTCVLNNVSLAGTIGI